MFSFINIFIPKRKGHFFSNFIWIKIPKQMKNVSWKLISGWSASRLSSLSQCSKVNASAQACGPFSLCSPGKNLLSRLLYNSLNNQITFYYVSKPV